MRWWFQKRAQPDRDERVRIAQEALTTSRAEQVRARELAADLSQLHRENHITERVHRAMRGG